MIGLALSDLVKCPLMAASRGSGRGRSLGDVFKAPQREPEPRHVP